MSQQEQQGEAQRWEEEAAWLSLDDRNYVRWLNSFGPWWLEQNNDEKWIKEHQ